MKLLKNFLCKLFGKEAKYRYYILVLTEKYVANNDSADTYLSGYIFRSYEEAAVYAEHLMDSTIMFGGVMIETLESKHRHLCASLSYPKGEYETMKVTYVEPIPMR